MNHYQHTTTRIVRTLIGVSLLVYIFTNDKMSYWLPFYTFHTNVFVGVWYILSGLFPGKEKPSFWIKDGCKGSVTTYITITGLVYNTLLISWEISIVGYLPFVSVITHMVVPVMMILDYLLIPAVEEPQWKQLPFWLTYPILYAAFVITIGASYSFYPYPFINPTEVGSTIKLIFNYIGLLAVHVGLASLYLGIARKKWKKSQT